jgi:hypothetical protein
LLQGSFFFLLCLVQNQGSQQNHCDSRVPPSRGPARVRRGPTRSGGREPPPPLFHGQRVHFRGRQRPHREVRLGPARSGEEAPPAREPPPPLFPGPHRRPRAALHWRAGRRVLPPHVPDIWGVTLTAAPRCGYPYHRLDEALPGGRLLITLCRQGISPGRSSHGLDTRYAWTPAVLKQHIPHLSLRYIAAAASAFAGELKKVLSAKMGLHQL